MNWLSWALCEKNYSARILRSINKTMSFCWAECCLALVFWVWGNNEHREKWLFSMFPFVCNCSAVVKSPLQLLNTSSWKCSQHCGWSNLLWSLRCQRSQNWIGWGFRNWSIFEFFFKCSHSIIHRRRQWHPTPVLLPGKSHGWRSLVAAVYGATQSRTRLKWLSSSSSSSNHSFSVCEDMTIGYRQMKLQ